MMMFFLPPNSIFTWFSWYFIFLTEKCFFFHFSPICIWNEFIIIYTAKLTLDMMFDFLLNFQIYHSRQNVYVTIIIFIWRAWMRFLLIRIEFLSYIVFFRRDLFDFIEEVRENFIGFLNFYANVSESGYTHNLFHNSQLSGYCSFHFGASKTIRCAVCWIDRLRRLFLIAVVLIETKHLAAVSGKRQINRFR